MGSRRKENNGGKERMAGKKIVFAGWGKFINR